MIFLVDWICLCILKANIELTHSSKNIVRIAECFIINEDWICKDLGSSPTQLLLSLLFFHFRSGAYRNQKMGLFDKIACLEAARKSDILIMQRLGMRDILGPFSDPQRCLPSSTSMGDLQNKPKLQPILTDVRSRDCELTVPRHGTLKFRPLRAQRLTETRRSSGRCTRKKMRDHLQFIFLLIVSDLKYISYLEIEGFNPSVLVMPPQVMFLHLVNKRLSTQKRVFGQRPL